MEIPIAGLRRWELSKSSFSTAQQGQRTIQGILRNSLQATRATSDHYVRRLRTTTATLFREKDEPESQPRMTEESSTKPSNVREQLLKARLAYPDIRSVADDEQKWIPNAAIKEIITVESVTKALEGLYSHDAALELANEVVNDGYRKLFAILVLLGKAFSIQRLIAESIRDVVLPLRLETSATGSYLVLRRSNSPLSCFSDWDDEELERFNSTQFWVLTPFFAFPEAGAAVVKHYALEDQHILPFMEDNSSSSAEGRYGRVYKVEYHPSPTIDENVQKDRFRPSHAIDQRGEQQFAVKSFDRADDFNQEVAALSIIQGNKHPHIVSAIAGYQQEEKYNIIMEWANGGTLKELWDSLGDADRMRPGMLLWVLEQLYGITSALQHIQQPKPSQVGEIRHGTHGDLKPQNILWFRSDCDDASRGHGILKISDFGNTRFSRTEEPQPVGDSIGMTITYRPPEIDDIQGKISRSSDIWAMGCMFLEFITWYLLGKEGVDEFARQRLSDDPSLGGILSDTFFTAETSRSSSVMRVKPGVLKWDAKLRCDPRATEAVQAMLDLIKDQMLLVDPRRRGHIDGILCRLNEIKKQLVGAETQPSDHCVSEPTQTTSPKAIDQTTGETLRDVEQKTSNSPLPEMDDDLALILHVPSRTISIFDRWRGRFEDWLGAGPIDWSPLSPINRPRLLSHSRLVWKYGDKTLWIELDKDETLRCRNRGIRTVVVGDDVLPRFQQSGGSGSKQNPAQQTPSLFLSYLLSLFKRRKRDENEERKGPNGTRPAGSSAPRPSHARNESYFCVDKTWAATKKTSFTVPIIINDLADDEALYRRLNETLGIHRWGPLHHLLSWQSYNAVKLSQFTFLHDDNDLVSVTGSDRVRPPTSICNGYEVPAATAQTQGVDLDVYLRITGERILTGLQDPAVGKGRTRVIDSLPKRAAPPILARKADVNGWGYHVCTGLCLRPLIVLVNGALLLGLAFVPFWLTSINKIDLQSAFAPVTFMGTVLTLWIALAALEQAL